MAKSRSPNSPHKDSTQETESPSRSKKTEGTSGGEPDSSSINDEIGNDIVVAEVEPEDAEELLEKVGIPASALPDGTKLEIVAHRESKTIHMGPLPPPDMLREYDSVFNNGAERVVVMAEKEQAHRHQWEKDDLGLATKEILRGQGFGFIVLLVAIGAAIYFANNGNNIAAGLFLTATVIGAATKFIPGRFSGNQKKAVTKAKDKVH